MPTVPLTGCHSMSACTPCRRTCPRSSTLLLPRSVQDVVRLRAVSRSMRDRVQRTPYGCVVRIGICLPDEATFSLDECVRVSVPPSTQCRDKARLVLTSGRLLSHHHVPNVRTAVGIQPGSSLRLHRGVVPSGRNIPWLKSWLSEAVLTLLHRRGTLTRRLSGRGHNNCGIVLKTSIV